MRTWCSRVDARKNDGLAKELEGKLGATVKKLPLDPQIAEELRLH